MLAFYFNKMNSSSYRFLCASRRMNYNKKYIVKQYHVLVCNNPKKMIFKCSGSLLNNSENKTTNNYNQKSSFHSFLESYISVFQALSESSAVVATQGVLTEIHNKTGLPWWATIITSTVLFRSAVTMPLALYQQYILAKVENLRSEFFPLVKELQKEMNEATKVYNWSPAQANLIYERSLKKQWTLLIEKNNCHPAKAGIIMLFQIPMWILFSMSIRNLVAMRPNKDETAVEIFDQLKHEGFLWIPDLTVPDDTMITSTLLCLVSITIIEVNRLVHIKESSRLKTIVVNLSRFFALLTFPFGLLVPSCLSFYWLTSASIGLVQNLAVMSPRVKLLAGVPRTPTTMQHPYKHLWKKIQICLKILPKTS